MIIMRRVTPFEEQPEYKTYINSEAWKKKRLEWFAAGYEKKCYCCSKPYEKGFHLHHRSYKRFGNEYLMDLTLVCQPCHTFIHQIHDNSKLDLWRATRKAKTKIERSKRQGACAVDTVLK